MMTDPVLALITKRPIRISQVSRIVLQYLGKGNLWPPCLCEAPREHSVAMMTTRKDRVLRIGLTLSLVMVAGAFASSAQFYEAALVDAFFAIALASVLILHLRVSPKLSEVLCVLAGTALFAAVDFDILHYPPKLMAWFSFLGLSSFLVMAVRAVWATAEERKMLLYAFLPALLFVGSEYFASTMLEWTISAHPKTLDLYLLSFDASLHVQMFFVAGRAFVAWHWLRFLGLLFYVGLAIPISLVYAGQLVRIKQRALPAMLAFLITGPVGIVFYNLFPASGPRYLLQERFPFYPLSIAQAARIFLEPVAIPGARNAMPSLHMAWTLLAWWYSRGLSWWERSIAFLFVVFTVVATLGTGEHYFADLVVAFPFALMIEAACAYLLPWRNSSRLTALLFGLLVTLAWLLSFRYAARLFWWSPVVPWALGGATIALTSARQSSLQKSAKAGTSLPTYQSVLSTRTSMNDLAP